MTKRISEPHAEPWRWYNVISPAWIKWQKGARLTIRLRQCHRYWLRNDNLRSWPSVFWLPIPTTPNGTKCATATVRAADCAITRRPESWQATPPRCP